MIKKGMICIVLILCGFTLRAQNILIMGGEDRLEGSNLQFAKIEASDYIKDDKKYSYKPENSRDWKKDTAWCIHGDGRGAWIKYYIDLDNSPGTVHGIYNVYRVGLINGFAVSKDLYLANNRIKKARIEFSNGKFKDVTFKDNIMDYQILYFNVKSTWVKITILDTYKGLKYNDTCISEVLLESEEHPMDMTDQLEKNSKMFYEENGVKWEIDNGGFK